MGTSSAAGRVFMHALLSLMAAGLLAACAEAPSTLSPHGPAAAQIVRLWWIMAAVGGGIFVGVMALLAAGLFRRRAPQPAEPVSPAAPPEAKERPWIVGGGVILPAVVAAGLLVLSVGTMRAVLKPASEDALVIEVVGHQWWWEVRYPDHAIITANELHLPAGQPVEIALSSVDVVHSFWVPELHGKFDLIPGRGTRFVLQADQPGEYRGQCAEFCGLQHAKMAFMVVAHPPEEFAAWLTAEAQPAAAPAEPLASVGQVVFLTSACSQCHTVRGTPAAGGLGPDLTHLASRRTLGAGSLPNTASHLEEWIRDPQAIKPGISMPAANLGASDLAALLAYLESLK